MQDVPETFLDNVPCMVYRCAYAPAWTMTYVSAGCVDLTGYDPGDLVGGPVVYGDLIHPEDRDRVWATVSEAVTDHRPFEVVYRLRAREGELWVWEQGRGVYDAEGEPVAVDGFISNVSTFVMEEMTLEARVEARTREVERRRRVAEGMLETLRVLNSSQPFDTVLSHITKQARELLGTAAVALYRLDPEDDVLRIQATLGLPEHYSREIELPLGHGALGRALVEARPVVVTDVPAFVAGENDRDSEGNEVIVSDRVRAVLREMTHLYGALVAVPVAVRGEAYGGLALYYPEPRTFSDEEIDLVTAFADQAALAIENERARIQTERAAAVAERQRLARELHDSVSQALYGIGLGARTALAWLDRAGASGDGAVLANLRRPLDYILGLAESGLTEMRSLIFKLHPEKLEEEGLSAALQQYTDRLARRDIAVESELCEEVDADLSVKEALYRIAQEAMNNVLKHAKATRVVLRLRCDVAGSGRGTLVLEVEDDGIGFDASACYPGHLGLTSMRERVEKLDGDLVIDSAPGAGTHLRVSVPV